MIAYEELPVVPCDGGRLNLRPIRESDTDDIVRWRNSPFICDRFIYREKFTPESHAQWLHERVMTGQVVQYIVEEADGRSIGSVYYQHFDDAARRAEFGIFLGGEDVAGKGYGKIACRTFTNFAFDQLRLHSSYARVLSDNLASRHMFLACGYKEEGIARDMVYVDDAYHDVVFYSLINPHESQG